MKKSKLIQMQFEKKYLWPIRGVMILISLPFILIVYETLITGVAEGRRYDYIQGEHWGYYSYLFKHFAISALFLWLGLFGISEKNK